VKYVRAYTNGSHYRLSFDTCMHIYIYIYMWSKRFLFYFSPRPSGPFRPARRSSYRQIVIGIPPHIRYSPYFLCILHILLFFFFCSQAWTCTAYLFVIQVNRMDTRLISERMKDRILTTALIQIVWLAGKKKTEWINFPKWLACSRSR